MTSLLAQTLSVTDVVDVESYPIHLHADDRLLAIITHARTQLDTTGCLHLPGFIRPAIVERLTAETNALAPEAFVTTRNITPYGDDGTSHTELPDDHPRRWTGTWSNGFVGKDRIP